MSKFINVEMGNAGVATVSINRPEALNALNWDLLTELKAALETLSKDVNTRAVILRGAGERAFVAGADIKDMQGMDRPQATQLSRLGHSVCMLLEHMNKTTIAAVHGFALGGGTELALACDFIMASEKAQFGLPEVGLGVVPGFGGTIRLSRAVGSAVAKELIFSGLRFSAQEAKDMGMIRIVYAQDSFFEEVTKLATKIAQNSMSAVITAKKLMNEFEEIVGIYPKVDGEIHQFAALFQGPDQHEGMLAFLEKRTPKFKGL